MGLAWRIEVNQSVLLEKGEVGDCWTLHAFTAKTDTRAHRSFLQRRLLSLCPTLAAGKIDCRGLNHFDERFWAGSRVSLPVLQQRQTGIAVNVRAVGTGQALDMARRGDADVVFVDAEFLEQQDAEGHGASRAEIPVMPNDFGADRGRTGTSARHQRYERCCEGAHGYQGQDSDFHIVRAITRQPTRLN